jgi:hypothetical protein
VLYVDGETSIIGYNSKNIQIDYTDDMAEKAGDSVITKLIGLKSSTVTQFAEKYVDTMEALSGTAEKTNSVDQLYERTKSLVLDLESEKMDKESFTVNGKKEKCQVYRITFNAEDMVDYVEDCYELSGAADGSIDFIIENILNCDVDDLYSDAREKAESIEDIDVYFAVNNKKQLVSMYSDNINNTGINVRIDFLGGDYLCDEVLFTFTKDTGESFTLRKDDISEGDYLGEMYEYEYIDGENKSYNGSITYSFEDDEITLEIDRDGSMNTYSVDIVDYKKGKYIELSAKGYDIYIGSEVRKIEKPEGDTLNLLNTDILSAYSFFSDFLSKDN